MTLPLEASPEPGRSTKRQKAGIVGTVVGAAAAGVAAGIAAVGAGAVPASSSAAQPTVMAAAMYGGWPRRHGDPAGGW